VTINSTPSRVSLLLWLLLLLRFNALAQESPTTHRRQSEIRHLDLTYSLPEYRTKEEWLARAAKLRQQIMVSAGLWPLPVKAPLNATIFNKVDRGDHTIEKVYFESYPGFYVTGNLYRPKNISGKVPAVLCPHGHWTYGRLENQENNSGPARAANFARQGYVAFSYDMVGYVDNTAISHRFADHNITKREALWGINLLGLQLWNSIRALDFLLALPEVDADRVACTGESGGGTQTFLLTAVDERIKVAAPVNMVSFSMQGGSLCENAPNLRIDTNNVEIAALMAPRPMLLVSATGDWTKNMMTAEYPAIRRIYRLFSAEDKLAAVQMKAPHNYNQESREAVYGWFAHWLLGRNGTAPIKEKSGGVASISDLLVFFGRPRPENELNETQLSASLIEMRQRQLNDLQPQDAAGLQRFREQLGTAFKYSVMAEYPEPSNIVTSEVQKTEAGNVMKESMLLSRRGWADKVPVVIYKPSEASLAESLVLLVGNTNELIEPLTKAGHGVMLINNFSGQRQIPASIKFFTTYNRTDEANHVQDILTALAYAKAQFNPARLSVIAQGEAGAWALLARGLAPQIDQMAVDALRFNTESDEEFLRRLPIPSLRRAGDFTTAVTMAPHTPLLIHNTGEQFRTARVAAVYSRMGHATNFKTQKDKITDAELVKWLSVK
jgi:dienelactone hydrolase